MLLQKLVLSYISKIAVQFIQMVAMFIVAQLLGPTVLGTVAFGLAFVSMFLFVADFGLNSAHIKLISEGRDEGSCIATFAGLKLLLILLYDMVVLSVFFGQKYIAGVPFESKEHEYVIIIYLVITTIGQFQFIATTTFAAKTEQAKQDIPALIQTLLYQVFRVIVAVLGFTAVALAFSNLAAVVLVFPVYIYLFRNYPFSKFDRKLAKAYLGISLPVFVVTLAQTVIYNSDKVLLQYMTNSEEVGYYSVSYSIAIFIRLIESSAGLLFFPFFSKNIANNDIEKINTSIGKYERFTFAFILPLVMLIVICSDLVVKVALGPKFAQTPPILSVITLALFSSVLILPYLNVISAKGLFKLSAVIHVVIAVFFVSAVFVTVYPPLLNLQGVGIALSLLLANILLGAVFMYFVTQKVKGVKILQGKNILMFGVLYSAGMYFIYHYTLNLFIFKIIFLPVFAGGYLFLAYIFRIIRKDDWMMIKEIVNYRKLYGYVSTEIMQGKKDNNGI